MIQIGIDFLKEFSSNEQLVMLQLLLNADENGLVEFSDRALARVVGISYQQVRTVHKNLTKRNVIANALPNAALNAALNAAPNAVGTFVTICKYASYTSKKRRPNAGGNAVPNAVPNAASNAKIEQETIKEKEKVSSQTLFHKDIENNKEQDLFPPLYPPKGKPKGYENFDFSFVDDNFYDVFVRWLDYRRDEKKPKFIYASQRTLEDCYKTLVEISRGIPEAAEGIIRHCTSSGYQGIFAPRNFWWEWERKHGKVVSQEEKSDPWKPNLEKYEPADLEFSERFNAYRIPNKFPICDHDWPYTPENRPDGARVCNGSDVWVWNAELKIWREDR